MTYEPTFEDVLYLSQLYPEKFSNPNDLANVAVNYRHSDAVSISVKEIAAENHYRDYLDNGGTPLKKSPHLSPNLAVNYESNLEIGQFIQLCACADAFVSVASMRDDNQALDFEAKLVNQSEILDRTEGYVKSWRSQKQHIATYRLNIMPKVGDKHRDYRDISIEGVFFPHVAFEGNKTAFVDLKISRRESIIYDIPYTFHIEDNDKASGEEPFVESAMLAALTNDFKKWPEQITASAKRFGVPKILILSIAVMETTHGWYDEPWEWLDLNASIRPMNINVDYWPELFDRDNMYDTQKNIDAGAFMLARIIDRLPANDRSVKKIATLYNNINAEKVTDYGARVDYFVRTLKPKWLVQ